MPIYGKSIAPPPPKTLTRFGFRGFPRASVTDFLIPRLGSPFSKKMKSPFQKDFF
jgi:hypothetical protein